jgi:hypothetical protein
MLQKQQGIGMVRIPMVGLHPLFLPIPSLGVGDLTQLVKPDVMMVGEQMIPVKSYKMRSLLKTR